MLEEVVEPNLREGMVWTMNPRDVAFEVGSTRARGDAILRGQVNVQVSTTIYVATAEMDPALPRREQVHTSIAVVERTRGRRRPRAAE
jgi:hypothetical protein